MAEFINETESEVEIPYLDEDGVDGVLVVGVGATIVSESSGPVAEAAKQTELTEIPDA